MKKICKLLAVMMVCIILCGVNTGIETCGQEGKDIMEVLSYSQGIKE